MTQPQSRFLEGVPRLHYLEWNPGGRRSFVLLHGNSANAWWWESVADELPPDARVLAVDQRGHGDSEWVAPPAYGPEDYGDDLARFIAAVFPAGQKPLVVGHSMGGLGVLAFASRYPDLARGAIAIDVALTSSRRRDRYLKRLRALPTVVYPDLETAKMRFRLMPDEGDIPRQRVWAIAERSLARTEDGGYTLKFDRECFLGGDGLDVMSTVREVGLATLLVRAERSRIMTPEGAEMACATNRKLSVVVIPGAHHHVLLEKPRELACVIVEFAESLDAPID
jgi:pimeloyl-ACP methyl ester carboxylesterase